MALFEQGKSNGFSVFRLNSGIALLDGIFNGLEDLFSAILLAIFGPNSKG